MTRFYDTQEWRRLRAACIAQHPVCATAGCGQRSIVADHVVPRSRGGSDTLDNLVGRCITCHNARRGTAEPRLRGCDANGIPRDRGHPWHASGKRKNLSGLSPGTAWGEQRRVRSDSAKDSD
ncbi:MAG: HNH endonuclease [Acetobacteraceae bacterium]|nr:HNH endonuclease [Acetobacteraceae bacterium]